jgi:hypothetical protein
MLNQSIELSLSPEPVPIPLQVHNTTPLPLYTRESTPPPPLTPSSKEKTLVDANDHPSPDWQINYNHQGIQHMVTMPGNNPDIQEVAKYLQINTNDGDPILCTTIGSGQPIQRSPLYAKPRKTPRPTLMEQELFFF